MHKMCSSIYYSKKKDRILERKGECSITEKTEERIKVFIPGVKEKMIGWIENRGGVQVWDNINLSDPGAGQIFTPALTEDGKEYPKPKWTHKRGEVVTEISRFRFVKKMVEVKRFYVAIRMGSQGLSMKCTDGATRKIRRACAKAGPDASYRFDYGTQEAVIEIPEWEND